MMAEMRYYDEGWRWPLIEAAGQRKDGTMVAYNQESDDRRQTTDDGGRKADDGGRTTDAAPARGLDGLEAGKIEPAPGEPQVTIDAVCPKCFRPLPGPRMFPEPPGGGPDRYGRELRKYLGFCPACNLGCEVIQFHRDGRWVIHRYQHYQIAGSAMHCVADGKWVTINELPEPAPVVVGPGGEFDKQIYPLGITPQAVQTPGLELLSKLRKALEGLCQTIECLMRGPGL
jgi:hypothetical protein